MIKSNFNILVKIHNSKQYAIINSLSGNADILSEEEYNLYLSKRVFENSEFFEKGYVTEIENEKKLYRKKYFEFKKSLETDEVQIFFIPWYFCNFNCVYCYQSGYEDKFIFPERKVIDEFFIYLNKEFTGRKKYITLFGGEPLLIGEKQKEFIKYFLEKIKENNLELSIVTNGYYLEEYLPYLNRVRIREIQVTLDGLEKKHNERRHLSNGKDSFIEIVNAIDKSLDSGFTINLRFVCDKENINELPGLADFAIQKGWTKKGNFKTQIGRNYELHFCQEKRDSIFSRIELYKTLYNLINEYPQISEFYKPAFSISKFLFENGKLPEPLFDDCPGTKTEWAFDGLGKFFSCTATAGKTGMELGSFYPKVTKFIDKIEEWNERDITTIGKCKMCNLSLICGGGCAAIANYQNGKILSEDCRPIDELISLGLSHYFE